MQIYRRLAALLVAAQEVRWSGVPVHGRMVEPRLMQQALLFEGHVYTVQYVDLRGYCL